MPSNSKPSSKKPMHPRSLKLNDRNKGTSISKRRQKATKHCPLIDASIQTDLIHDIQSQISSSSSIETEERSIQPSESIAKDDSEDHINLRVQINPPSGGPLLMFSTANESEQSRSSCDIRKPMKIAFSYAGKTEDRVEIISQLIHQTLTTPQSPFPVFYAPNFQGQLSGYNATDILLDIYDNASLVVVFLSNAYTRSSHCQDEWRRIRERFVHGQGRTQRRRLIFVKLNEFNRKKLNLTRDDFFIDGLKHDDQQIADMIIGRWKEVGKLSSRSPAKS